MKWYDFNSEEKQDKLSVLLLRSEKIHCELVSSFDDIVKLRLDDNIQYRFVTNKAFNAMTVADYIEKHYFVDEMYIAVYRMNLFSVEKIKNFASKNYPITILLSNFFRENKKYERWTRELDLFASKKSNIDVCYALSHAKVFLCKTACGKYIVFEGSGNLSDNSRIEQYLLENNEKVYNFHKKWILDEFNRLAK